MSSATVRTPSTGRHRREKLDHQFWWSTLSESVRNCQRKSIYWFCHMKLLLFMSLMTASGFSSVQSAIPQYLLSCSKSTKYSPQQHRVPCFQQWIDEDMQWIPGRLLLFSVINECVKEIKDLWTNWLTVMAQLPGTYNEQMEVRVFLNFVMVNNNFFYPLKI